MHECLDERRTQKVVDDANVRQGAYGALVGKEITRGVEVASA